MQFSNVIKSSTFTSNIGLGFIFINESRLIIENSIAEKNAAADNSSPGIFMSLSW